MSGAVRAITTMRKPTRPPAAASGLRRVKAASSRATGGAPAPRRAAAPTTSPTPAVVNPRGEPRVAQGDGDVDEHEGHRGKQEQVLDHHPVPIHHRDV